MKKILLIGAGLVLFAGCTPEIPAESGENIPAVEFGDAVDLTNLFAQVCETENGPCKNISCSLVGDTYSCYENISKRTENCSSVKTKDEVISKYKICGLEGEVNPENIQFLTTDRVWNFSRWEGLRLNLNRKSKKKQQK